MLVAGATGSGKSVFLMSLVASLLSTRDPTEVELLIIDPKQTDLTIFNGAPHLVSPASAPGGPRGGVITDMDAARIAVHETVVEMERRNHLLNQVGVKDLTEYSRKALIMGWPQIPFRVVIIDEFASLTFHEGEDGAETELSRAVKREGRERAARTRREIIKLANMGRSAGIHLVLATQTPRAEVLDKQIQNNCQCRVAFRVAEKAESRFVLEETGAEMLAGQGDMMFKGRNINNGDIIQKSSLRVRSPYISRQEVERLVAFWKSHSDDARKIISGVASTTSRREEMGPRRGRRAFVEEVERLYDNMGY
jgi:S-DNA-T family DNA segregation ATPase FtsK/SpoIIIE